MILENLVAFFSVVNGVNVALMNSANPQLQYAAITDELRHNNLGVAITGSTLLHKLARLKMAAQGDWNLIKVGFL